MKNTFTPADGNGMFQFPQPPALDYGLNPSLIKKMYRFWLKSLIKETDNPKIIPANGHDICNYVARYGLANYQIQAILTLDGNIDPERMKKAVRLSFDAEPVLGCKFIESDPPYWRRRDNIDELPFFTFEETDNMEDAILQFLKSPFDMDEDAMVKVRLIRSGPSDALCLKINHACADGTGAKDYLMLLADIYSRLCKDSNYVPPVHKRTHRDQNKLFEGLGIKNPELLPAAPNNFPPMWNFPWKKGRRKKPGFVVCRLPYGQVEKLSEYAKSRGATINDLVLTAYYRALFKLSKPLYFVPMEIPVTVDLRRYLPEHKAEAIRNLSGGIEPRLARMPKENFDRTLSRVTAVMNRLKNNNPGLPNAIAAERVERMSYIKFRDYIKSSLRTSNLASLLSFMPNLVFSPGLSNLGLLSKSLIKFGDITAVDAYILPPAVRDPGLLLIACTYNGILSLTTTYYESTVKRRNIEILLNKIKDELIRGCNN